MSENENMEIVQNVVRKLKEYASGDYFLYKGKLFPIDYEDFNVIEGCTYNEGVYAFPGGTEVFEGDIEPANLYNYFSDYLGVDYVVDSNKEYKAARVMVTCGGPNIFIDSYEGEVQLYWGMERATAKIPANICEEINNVFREFYYC